jgi:hypothetical protein
MDASSKELAPLCGELNMTLKILSEIYLTGA